MTTPHDAFRRLVSSFGPQGWWPASTRAGRADAWEVIVGAVLVQHTQWANVVRAIRSLAAADAMSVGAVRGASDDTLAEWVRPAGTPRVKAERLRAVAELIAERFGGSVERLLEGVADRRVALARRDVLLGVRGVGPETADAILLYAGGAPVFVSDAYKRRVMARHGWGPPAAKYDAVAEYWRSGLPADPAVYNEAHALLVRVGVEHCKKARPLCEGCPLAPLLPRGGPLPP